MKKITLLFVGLISSICYAQMTIPDALVIREKKMQLDKVERNGFSLEITGETKQITKRFDAYAKENEGLQLKNKAGKLIQLDALKTDLSDKHVNIYAYCSENGESNELHLFVSFGTDIYINSVDYPAESEKIQLILRNFGKAYYTDFVNMDVTTKNSALKKQNKLLSETKKEINSSSKFIAKRQIKTEKLARKRIKTEEKIRKLEATIEENEVTTAELNEAVKNKTETLEEQKKKESELTDDIKITTEEIAVLLQKIERIKNY